MLNKHIPTDTTAVWQQDTRGLDMSKISVVYRIIIREMA